MASSSYLSKVVRRPGSQRLCASGVARLPAGRGRKRIGSVVSLKPHRPSLPAQDRANTSGLQERAVSIAELANDERCNFRHGNTLGRTNSRPRAGHNLPHYTAIEITVAWGLTSTTGSGYSAPQPPGATVFGVGPSGNFSRKTPSPVLAPQPRRPRPETSP